MLTRQEALELAIICDQWPGGMGCVLLPKPSTKRGYVSAEWGWKDHVPGNFNYTALSAFPSGALLCPVTKLGVLRTARNFRDHLAAYDEIRSAVMTATLLSQKEAKIEYNRLLSKDPRALAALFRKYAESIQENEYSSH